MSAKAATVQHVGGRMAATVGGAVSASKESLSEAVRQIRVEEKAARVAEAVRDFYTGVKERIEVRRC